MEAKKPYIASILNVVPEENKELNSKPILRPGNKNRKSLSYIKQKTISKSREANFSQHVKYFWSINRLSHLYDSTHMAPIY